MAQKPLQKINFSLSLSRPFLYIPFFLFGAIPTALPGISFEAFIYWLSNPLYFVVLLLSALILFRFLSGMVFANFPAGTVKTLKNFSEHKVVQSWVGGCVDFCSFLKLGRFCTFFDERFASTTGFSENTCLLKQAEAWVMKGSSLMENLTNSTFKVLIFLFLSGIKIICNFRGVTMIFMVP